MGNKGIYSKTVCLFSRQIFGYRSRRSQSLLCFQAYQGVFLCQKNQCLFTGTTLTFQRTGMAHRGMGAGTIQFYWIWNLFPSSFFLYFFILTEEYLWFLIKPQDTQVCLGWFLQGSFHFIFTLLPFFLFLKNA